MVDQWSMDNKPILGRVFLGVHVCLCSLTQLTAPWAESDLVIEGLHEAI